MAPFVYRCPNTGLNVQGWVADDPTEGEGEIYAAITFAAGQKEAPITRRGWRGFKFWFETGGGRAQVRPRLD